MGRKLDVVLAVGAFPQSTLDEMEKIVAPAEFIHVVASDVENKENFPIYKKADAILFWGVPSITIVENSTASWIHCGTAGMDYITRMTEVASERMITCNAGKCSPSLAEHTWFFILSLAYGSPKMHEAQKEKAWGFAGMRDLQPLAGKKLGLIGYGNIGQQIIQRARGFEMDISVYVRSPKTAEGVTFYSGEEGLDKILTESDFVVLALPLTNDTAGLISREKLALMKPTAYFINMARGRIVDQDALCDALYEGKIAGAGLDVFNFEPLPADDRLWSAPNTVITPHFTPDPLLAENRALDILKENVQRFRDGLDMKNRLAEDDKYRP